MTRLNELKDLLNFLYDKKISHVINPYEGWNYISKLMYLYILSKHNNDCIIVSQQKNRIDIMLYLDYDNKSFIKLEYPANDLEDYFSKITNCKNRGLTFIALPLSIRFLKKNKLVDDGHQNMIVINLITNEVYRFEPHGYQYMLEDEYNSIDDALKNEFENKMNFKYNSAKVVCPRKGFQVLESDIKYEIGEVGYCAAWSYFFLDLVFTYPNMNITDVVTKALDILNNDPETIRNFIRSYVRFISIEVDSIIEKVFDINNPYDNPTKIKKILNDIEMNKWGVGITRLYTDKISDYINQQLINQAHKPYQLSSSNKTPKISSITKPSKVLLEDTPNMFDIKSFKPSKVLLEDTPNMFDIKSFKPSKVLLEDTPTMFDIKSFKPSKVLLEDTPTMFDIKSFKPSKVLLEDTPNMFDIKSFKPSKVLLKGGKRKSNKMIKKKSSKKKRKC
jgi:hypothetical protein